MKKKFDFEHSPVFLKRFINKLVGFRFFYPYGKLKIIGVTGTSGKTTTTTLLYRIAKALGYKAGLIGTVENFIGNRKVTADLHTTGQSGFFNKIFFTASGTTPETWELNNLLSEMAKEGCEYVFMEVSSHSLEEKRVSGIKFVGGIFTNLSHEHLDFHKDMQNYFLAKKRLFKMLSSDAFALSNVDDVYGVAMIEDIKAKKYLYGFGELQVEFPNDKKTPKWWDFHGKIMKSDFDGLELDFGGEKIKSKLLGEFNAYNLLAVWSACRLLGFDMKKVKKILEDVEPPRGRFDHFMSPSGVLIVVDYAHLPDALEKILVAVNNIRTGGGRIISVFGCGGDRDPSKRSKMGKIGARLSDIAIFTSDNPRSEDPDKIIEQMKDDLMHEESVKVITIADRRLAIAESVKLAKEGDIILCAGKGHEDYQEVKGVKNDFNDMEEFKKLF